MSKLDEFLHPELVVTGLQAKDRTDAIQQLAALMHQYGYVKDSYLDAVLEREKKFPTGLVFEDGQIALPHSDIEHCLKPAVTVGILKQPVEFFEMATLDKVVNTKIIILLSIIVPEDQVVWLSRLVNLCQKPGFLKSLEEASDAQLVYELLFRELRKEKSNENI